MIRIRLKKNLKESDFLEKGYLECTTKSGVKYFSKNVGSHEIQVKLSFPGNIRIQNWDDNRAPWILMKFLEELELEKGNVDKVKILDQGRYRILKVKDTLELIKELNWFSDIRKRLSYWYKKEIGSN